MRLPYSWLRDVVQAGAPGWDVSPDELEQTLIRIGHEVEEIIPVGPVTGPLTVGRVVEIEEVTDFKKPIRAVKVDVGEAEPRDIVCGATNFAVGDLVVVALPGTVLPGDFTIATQQFSVVGNEFYLRFKPCHYKRRAHRYIPFTMCGVYNHGACELRLSCRNSQDFSWISLVPLLRWMHQRPARTCVRVGDSGARSAGAALSSR